MSPREPNDGSVFWAIWVIYDKAEGSFVKQVTPGRFSLRQGRSEPVGDFGVGNGVGDTGSGKDRRWVSNFNHGNRGSLCGQQSPGGREMAKGCGSRCWSRPWKNFPGPISAACPAIRRCWWRYARNWRGRCHLAHMAHPVSACEIRLGKIRLGKKPHLSNRIRQIRARRLHSPAICSRGCLPRSIPRSLASSRAM